MDELLAVIPRIAALITGADDPDARRAAATELDRLRPLLAGQAQLAAALDHLAAYLRAPSPAHQAAAEDAIAELQAQWALPERKPDYQAKARAAMDDYFQANPIKPFKG